MSDEERMGFVGRRENYSLVKNLRVEIEGEERAFFLCFWIYLVNSFAFPLTLLQKAQLEDTADSPFLVINEKEVTLFELPSLHKEASSLNVPGQSIDFEFPLERWVHFGCEVSDHLIRLHIDGKIMGERVMSLVYEKESSLSNGLSNKIVLFSANGDEKNEGFIYNLEILPATLSVQDHHSKYPPVQLCLDKSPASEIELGDDGVWNIVGGKVSCRRNFSLDVLLINAFGQPVSRESEVFALLVYVDTGEPVEKTSDDEAPLLASYDGVEISTLIRPSKLLNGRASFKLKLSQLSSKCQSRLFHIMFHLPETEAYPFFKAFSPPIRSISRNRITRISSSSITWRRPTSTLNPTSQLSGPSADFMEAGQDSSNKARSDLSSKRQRLGPDGISERAFGSYSMLEPPEEECDSHAWPKTKVEDRDMLMTSSTMQPENSAEDISSTDSESTESTELRNLDPKSTSSSGSSISDMTVFKYGLAGLPERSLILKEISSSASDEDLLNFADQVSLYSGCSHHRSQILMTKRLVEEGTEAWNSISQNRARVPWQSMLFEIDVRFMKISCCRSRSLSHQDFEFLRRISGCEEYAARENFEQMWCWLYPVAQALSWDPLKELWSCASSPKWIEGFVTKEDTECSLAAGEPGTFVLRFPTSRKWPHPDAGSLVVTYVGPDHALHHRLLSLDHLLSSSQKKDNGSKPLQDMLLEEPELSRLGRIIRSH